MNKKTFQRMEKMVHDINNGPLSFPLIVKRLKPLDQQTNYNSKLREWYGAKDYDIVANTNGIFSAFKESEDWREIGTLSIHDFKCTINNTVDIDDNCLVVRVDTNEEYEVIFKREYIGEYVMGLRPVVK
jgi:hypothetical protein